MRSPPQLEKSTNISINRIEISVKTLKLTPYVAGREKHKNNAMIYYEMKREIEAKFLDADFDAVREKLQELSAKCEQSMQLKRYVIIDDTQGYMRSKGTFIQVQDDGKDVTLAYKKLQRVSTDAVQDTAVTVNSFEAVINIFLELGLRVRSHQESKRETWSLGEAKVHLDQWPWLKPLITISGRNERQIEEIAGELGYQWSDAVYGDIIAAYRVQYPILADKKDITSLPIMKFNSAPPNFFNV